MMLESSLSVFVPPPAWDTVTFKQKKYAQISIQNCSDTFKATHTDSHHSSTCPSLNYYFISKKKKRWILHGSVCLGCRLLAGREAANVQPPRALWCFSEQPTWIKTHSTKCYRRSIHRCKKPFVSNHLHHSCPIQLMSTSRGVQLKISSNGFLPSHGQSEICTSRTLMLISVPKL